MVIKIDANHGDNGEARKSPFIGREKEINEIIESRHADSLSDVASPFAIAEDDTAILTNTIAH